MNLKELGVIVSQTRKKLGITQKDLAAACGLSRATVSALESGKVQELGFGRVKSLGDFLGLEFSFLPSSTRLTRLPLSSKVLKRLRKRYIWWKIPGIEPDEDRVIAQVLDIGTYEDIKAMEAEVGRIRMKQVLSDAQPGWFSPKSWEYWHLMLGLSPLDKNPPLPRRTDAI